jgi:hypothetical protein
MLKANTFLFLKACLLAFIITNKCVLFILIKQYVTNLRQTRASLLVLRPL